MKLFQRSKAALHMKFKKNPANFYPFISVVIILVALFALVFLQMEVRRMGYVVLKQTRAYKNAQDEHRLKVMRFAKIMRADRLRDIAITQLTLNEAKSEQIVHMSGDKLAVRQ
ncbi:MAG: histidine kinase [Bdellovibrionales bacterium]